MECPGYYQDETKDHRPQLLLALHALDVLTCTCAVMFNGKQCLFEFSQVWKASDDTFIQEFEAFDIRKGLDLSDSAENSAAPTVQKQF